MTEIIPEDDDQIDGQLNLEDILQDWEGEPENVQMRPESDDLLEFEEGEELLRYWKKSFLVRKKGRLLQKRKQWNCQ